jgi:hypothetical protein
VWEGSFSTDTISSVTVVGTAAPQFGTIEGSFTATGVTRVSVVGQRLSPPDLVVTVNLSAGGWATKLVEGGFVVTAQNSNWTAGRVRATHFEADENDSLWTIGRLKV